MPRQVPTHDPAASADSGVGLIVDYADTADMDDGQPLPPYLDENVVWHVVRRQRGHTVWRRISLKPETPRSSRRLIAQELTRRPTRHER
jgi:hypothetical protein